MAINRHHAYIMYWKKNRELGRFQMRRKLKIYTCGFYIGMILWMCGLIASIHVENIVMKILLDFVPLVIYQFFTIISKAIIEKKIKK